MSIAVRLYTHKGLSTPPVTGSSGRLTTDSLFLLALPYLGGELVTTDTSGSVSSVAGTAPNGTKVAMIQVPPGSRAYYEATPQGQDARPATTNSPIIEGNVIVECGPGWTFAFREVSA